MHYKLLVTYCHIEGKQTHNKIKLVLISESKVRFLTEVTDRC